MTKRPRKPAGVLYCSIGDTALGLELLQETLQHDGPQPCAAFFLVEEQADGEVRFSSQCAETSLRSSVVTAINAERELAAELAACVAAIRQRSDKVRRHNFESHSNEVDVIVFSGLSECDITWTAKSLRALGTLQPIERTSGVRLAVLAPFATRSNRHNSEDVSAGACRLISQLREMQVPCHGWRILALDRYDRNMRCLSQDTLAPFATSLVCQLTQSVFRPAVRQALQQPIRDWAHSVISAGMTRVSNRAQTMAEQLVTELRSQLLEFWFARTELPSDPAAWRENLQQAVDAAIAPVTEADWPAGVFTHVLERVCQAAEEAESRLTFVGLRQHATPDPDCLGFRPPVFRAGWLRRLLRFIWPFPRPVDRWDRERRLHNDLRDERDRQLAVLDRAARVQGNIAELQNLLAGARAAEATPLPQALCRRVLERCDLTPSAASRWSQQQQLGLDSKETDSIRGFLENLERWTLSELDFDRGTDLSAALVALAARIGVPGRLLNAVASAIHEHAAAFFTCDCDPHRYQRKLFIAHPTEAAPLIAAIDDGGASVEKLVWEKEELLCVEFVEGLDVCSEPATADDSPDLLHHWIGNGGH